MYNWHADATECYAYLEDVLSEGSSGKEKNERLVPREERNWITVRDLLSDTITRADVEKQIRVSRWFTRGWTLQELIAPPVVIFLASDWSIIGEKRTYPYSIGHIVYTGGKIDYAFLNLLKEVAGVPRSVFEDSKTKLSDFPASRRLMWVSGRRTTKPEDMVYCMLGLMEVNMPLLYGEGIRRAFQRLQLQILGNSGDESLFCFQQYDEMRRRLHSEYLLPPTLKDIGTTALVAKASLHDRPPPTFSSNCVEIRMTSGRCGVFQHKQQASLCVIRLNCVSRYEHLDGSPSILVVRAAGCNPNHFIRAAYRLPNQTGPLHYDRPFYANTEDELEDPDNWVPRESNEPMFIHLHSADASRCVSDPDTPDEIKLRLQDRA